MLEHIGTKKLEDIGTTHFDKGIEHLPIFKSLL